jgi:type I restriction enzyme S subunit
MAVTNQTKQEFENLRRQSGISTYLGNEWPIVELGDVTDLLTGFPFRSAAYTTDPAAPRLLRGDNVAQGNLRWDGAKRWPKDATDDVEQYYLKEGDVILAMDRPWIEVGLKYGAVQKSDLPALLVQRVARLRGTNALDTAFLRYIIGSRAFTEHVLAVQTGTAVPHISGGQIKSFQFKLPRIEEQRAIAYILGTLDDKIELNRRMNETLEAMARALFKSWFVDFDPVRAKAEQNFEDSEIGQIPKGWRVRSVGDLAEIVGGSTPSTKNPSYWEGGSHQWVTPKDLSTLAVPVLFDTERRITDAGLGQISSGLLPTGTVLLSSRAPIGYLAVAEVPVAVNQGFIAMKPRHGISNLFLLLWAHHAHDEIVSRANGSTFLEISKSNFRPIPIAAPPDETMDAFDKIVRPLYQRIVMCARECLTLAHMRDTLLPKLISGEVRVKDAERQVEAVL